MSILTLLLSLVLDFGPSITLDEYAQARLARKVDAYNAYQCSLGDAEACAR